MDRKRLAAGAATVAVLALGGTGIAYAAGNDGGEKAAGPGIEQAKSAALDHTGGGQVTDTEVGDEEGYYEIEVSRDDGTQLDVHLDRDFEVLGTSADDEKPDDKDGSDDD